MKQYIWPPQSISVNSGPLEILVDGVPTQVDYNSGDPANSTAVPVYVVNGDGAGPKDFGVTTDAPRTAAQIGNATGAAAFGAGNSSAQTLRTVIATDQSAIPVSGPLTDAQLRATAVPVSGPLTDTQLRASAVPVSAASLPLPTGAATEATLSAINGKFNSLGQKTMAASVPVVIASDQSTVSVAVTSSALPTGAATAANQATEQTLIGALTETAPASDTASSGLNGRLQRIAQRITSLIALLPVSLGQKTMSGSLAVVLPSDQTAIPVTSNRVLSATMSQLTAAITAQTITAPANAKGFTIQNSTRAASAIRWRESSINASASTGFLLEPGQSTSYQDGAASLSIFAVDGAAIDVAVAWYV